jgi:hypothetical protein
MQRNVTKGIPDNRSNVVSRKYAGILCSKSVRNHDEWNFIGGKGTEVCFGLSIRISLSSSQ